MGAGPHEVEGVHRLGSLGFQVGPLEPQLTTSWTATERIRFGIVFRTARPHRVSAKTFSFDKPSCKKVIGLEVKARFSRFGRPRGGGGSLWQFGAHLRTGAL